MLREIKSWHIAVLFVLIGFSLYSNVIINGIFLFDDAEYVTENTLIKDFAHVNLNDPRQIGYLSFAVSYAMGGYDPRGYHALNVAIHVVNAILVFVLLRSLLELLSGTSRMRDDVRNATAFLASLVFLVHPVETMAVSYIAQRFTSLSAMFYLLSVNGYIAARRRFERDLHGRAAAVLYGAALLSTLLAVRTKEITFTIPLVLSVLELLVWKTSVYGRRRFFYVIPFVVLVLIIPLSILGPELGLLPPGEGIAEVTRQEKIYDLVERSFSGYLLTQFRVIVTYMRLLLVPVGQRVIYDYKMSTSLFDWRVLVALAQIGLVMAGAYYAWRKSSSLEPDDAAGARLVTVGTAWFFIALSVESSVIPIKDLIFEHRTYLPSVGFFAACSALIVMAVRRTAVRRPFPLMMALVIVLLAVPLSAATWVRNKVWTNELMFWDDVVRKSPDKAIGYHNRGNAYGKLGFYDQALEDINRVIAYFPKNPAASVSYEMADFTPGNMAKTYMNRGQVYLQLGRKELAQADFDRAKELVSAPPLDTERTLKLGDFYARKGAHLHAIAEYDKILQWDPQNLDALNNRSNSYSWTSNYRMAVEDLSRVILLYPEYAQGYHNRGVAYAWWNKRDRAAADFRKACEMGFQPACESIQPALRGEK